MATGSELSEPELYRVARAFGLEPKSAGPIEGGWENSSYLVAAVEGRFVATVLQRRGLAEAEARAGFLCQLSLLGLPVPAPRRVSEGGWALSHDGKPVVVSSFVAGTCGRPLEAGQLFDLGALLARVHGSEASCEAPPSVRLEARDLAWLEDRSEDDAFVRWALERYEDLAPAVADEDRRVPTHGDPFGDNIVVTAGGELVLIDWDDAGLDLPEVDLGMAILAHCDSNGLDLSRAEALLEGYRSAGSDRVDLGSTMRVAAYAGLVVAYWRYRRELSGRPAPGTSRSMQVMADSLRELSGSGRAS